MRAPQRLAHGLTAVKALALTAVLAVPVALQDGGAEPGGVTSSLAGDRALLSTQVLADLDCTTTAPKHPRPGTTALIRTPDGAVRQVPFTRGWASYTGRRPGDLIAVCLSD